MRAMETKKKPRKNKKTVTIDDTCVVQHETDEIKVATETFDNICIAHDQIDKTDEYPNEDTNNTTENKQIALPTGKTYLCRTDVETQQNKNTEQRHYNVQHKNRFNRNNDYYNKRYNEYNGTNDNNRRDNDRQRDYNKPRNVTCLDFSFDDFLNDYKHKKMSDCSVEMHIKYIIALTHYEGLTKKALCNVLKNTLTGMNGETNLPVLTSDTHYRRPEYKQRSTSVRQQQYNNDE